MGNKVPTSTGAGFLTSTLLQKKTSWPAQGVSTKELFFSADFGEPWECVHWILFFSNLQKDVTTPMDLDSQKVRVRFWHALCQVRSWKKTTLISTWFCWISSMVSTWYWICSVVRDCWISFYEKSQPTRKNMMGCGKGVSFFASPSRKFHCFWSAKNHCVEDYLSNYYLLF